MFDTYEIAKLDKEICFICQWHKIQFKTNVSSFRTVIFVLMLPHIQENIQEKLHTIFKKIFY